MCWRWSCVPAFRVSTNTDGPLHRLSSPLLLFDLRLRRRRMAAVMASPWTAIVLTCRRRQDASVYLDGVSVSFCFQAFQFNSCCCRSPPYERALRVLACSSCPPCIPHQLPQNSNLSSVVSGWGQKSSGGRRADPLPKRRVDVRLFLDLPSDSLWYIRSMHHYGASTHVSDICIL